MKKIITLILITTISYVNAQEVNKKKTDLKNVKFEALVIDLKDFYGDIRLRVKAKNHGRLTIKTNKEELGLIKEKDFISIECKDVKFKAYVNCNLKKIK